jgi:hypothetical protein
MRSCGTPTASASAAASLSALFAEVDSPPVWSTLRNAATFSLVKFIPRFTNRNNALPAPACACACAAPAPPAPVCSFGARRQLCPSGQPGLVRQTHRLSSADGSFAASDRRVVDFVRQRSGEAVLMPGETTLSGGQNPCSKAKCVRIGHDSRPPQPVCRRKPSAAVRPTTRPPGVTPNPVRTRTPAG